MHCSIGEIEEVGWPKWSECTGRWMNGQRGVGRSAVLRLTCTCRDVPVLVKSLASIPVGVGEVCSFVLVMRDSESKDIMDVPQQ